MWCPGRGPVGVGRFVVVMRGLRVGLGCVIIEDSEIRKVVGVAGDFLRESRDRAILAPGAVRGDGK